MKTKYIIAAAALFLAVATSTIDVKAQWDSQHTVTDGTLEQPVVPLDNTGERDPFSNQVPPSYVPPPGYNGEGDGQKLPPPDGFWMLIGLAIAYGLVCRKRKNTQ